MAPEAMRLAREERPDVLCLDLADEPRRRLSHAAATPMKQGISRASALATIGAAINARVSA